MSADFEEIEFQAQEQGRLDKIVTLYLKTLSRVRIQEAISNSMVRVNGIIISSCSYQIKPLDIIKFTLIIHSQSTEYAINNPEELNVVYEDEDIAIINKQAGLCVHQGAGKKINTLVDLLVLRYGQALSNFSGTISPGIVHRLDKNTSGLMVIAKSNIAHADLASQIKKKTAKRHYKALIYGSLSPKSAVIETNIMPSKNDRSKMCVVKSGGKSSITHYKTLEIFNDKLLSLIECRLMTGRTHQIRLHMSYKKHPLVGDKLYIGGQNFNLNGFSEDIIETLRNFSRQALHSYYLSFNHPKTNKNLSFEINMPDDMNRLLEKLRRDN